MCQRSFESLSPKDIDDIQKIMLPGGKSESGFLLHGDSLRDIYEADRKFLEKLGITYQQISDVLTTVLHKAIRKRHHHYEKTKDFWPEEGFLVDGRYRVKIVTYMGAQTCPFQDPEDKRYFGYEYGDSDITVTDEKTGRTLKYNTLLPHMIEHHHFFESPNVSHRLNPENVIDMLKSNLVRT